MDTDMKNAANAAKELAQYDEKAKRLLSNKSILAYILVNVVDGFMGMNPEEVVPYIEGEPYISEVPVDLGLTNAILEKDGERIVGLNTENSEINEGLIRFDIIFYVRMKDGLSQIIVNIEAQKDEPTGYSILMNIVLIGIANKLPEHEDKYEVHRLLSALLSTDISAAEKLEIIETEYNIPIDDRMREEVSIMCNLSQGILERGEARGEARGESRGEAKAEAKFIKSMYTSGYSLEQIAEVIEKSIEEVRGILQKAL